MNVFVLNTKEDILKKVCNQAVLGTIDLHSVPVAQWLEHCVSSAKGCGFDSQGTHIL